MFSRVYIEITNVCNMSCSFCHGHNREGRFMSPDEFREILDKLGGKTRYVYYHLMGEPLLHPELPLFIKEASERGFHSVITTNGTLLGKNGESLIDSGVYKVNISLHSFEEDNPAAQEAAAYNTYNITAEFPNANDVNEIREAILSLPNLASQYIGRNIK